MQNDAALPAGRRHEATSGSARSYAWMRSRLRCAPTSAVSLRLCRGADARRDNEYERCGTGRAQSRPAFHLPDTGPFGVRVSRVPSIWPFRAGGRRRNLEPVHSSLHAGSEVGSIRRKSRSGCAHANASVPEESRTSRHCGGKPDPGNCQMNRARTKTGAARRKFGYKRILSRGHRINCDTG